MNLYKIFARPVLFRLDPEKAHKLAVDLGSFVKDSGVDSLARQMFEYKNECLRSDFCRHNYDNPVGLAAGFDKNAEYIDMLSMLGFGFVEIGSVTAKPSLGNPKPRSFRLPMDRAIINRMGLNNDGADAVRARLLVSKPNINYGVNIAKTHNLDILGSKAIKDFCYSFKQLYSFGAYTAINISCPNTAEEKTFEDPMALDELLCAISEERRKFANNSQINKPLLLKLSPDVYGNDIPKKYLDLILQVAENRGIDGYVISNTSLGRGRLRTPKTEIEKIGRGGLSGAPIRSPSTRMIQHVYDYLRNSRSYQENQKIPQIIGCGGIFCAKDAYEKIKAGATLVQVYTGLIYEGPFLVKSIKKGLVRLLEKDGLKTISEAVGVEAG